MKINRTSAYISIFALGALGAACSDSASYSDLLRDENKAVNWYLAQQRVCNEIPADSIFEYGADAPYYRMDEDGYIYMQVINPGSQTSRPEAGQKIYFRFERKNILTMQQNNTLDVAGAGNSNDFSSNGNTSFVLGNTYLESSTQWGTGIQVPMSFLGYDSEVNLVMRAYYGFTVDQSTCTPYLINVRYFKTEY